MERFSQFRDRGSGIAPFIPVSTPISTFSLLVHASLFSLRLPFFLCYAAVYFLVLDHLPLPAAARKLLLWGLMGVPGLWWVDLQLDGVRRGRLAEQPPDRIPHPRSLIAANATSPVDAVYLAAVFDPIFTISYPGERRVRRVGLLSAVTAALAPVRVTPLTEREKSQLVDLDALLARYPDRVVCVFPEGGTTNGKAILPLTPSLLGAPAGVPIFPVSIRYTPSDVTTPVPGAWLRFLWDLLSRPTTLIRVRVAQSIKSGKMTDVGDSSAFSTGVDKEAGTTATLAEEEQRLLDKVAESLARLCRNKRVGLTLRDKAKFVEAWKGGSKS